MRSFLVVPGDRPQDMIKALDGSADAVVLDLEGVPTSRKSLAREAARAFLAEAGRRRARLLVRVHEVDDPGLEADLDALVEALPEVVVLPGAGGGGSVQRLSVKLAVREARAGAPDGGVGVIAVAANGASMFELGSYAGASRRLRALSWDPLRLARDIGARDVAAAPIGIARGLVLFAAAAAGVGAIDGPIVHALDPAAFREDCARARRDGFVGRFVASADHVAIVNEAFARGEAEIAEANVGRRSNRRRGAPLRPNGA